MPVTLTAEQEKAVAAHRLELERRGVMADELSDDAVWEWWRQEDIHLRGRASGLVGVPHLRRTRFVRHDPSPVKGAVMWGTACECGSQTLVMMRGLAMDFGRLYYGRCPDCNAVHYAGEWSNPTALTEPRP